MENDNGTLKYLKWNIHKSHFFYIHISRTDKWHSAFFASMSLLIQSRIEETSGSGLMSVAGFI